MTKRNAFVALLLVLTMFMACIPVSAATPESIQAQMNSIEKSIAEKTAEQKKVATEHDKLIRSDTVVFLGAKIVQTSPVFVVESPGLGLSTLLGGTRYTIIRDPQSGSISSLLGAYSGTHTMEGRQTISLGGVRVTCNVAGPCKVTKAQQKKMNDLKARHDELGKEISELRSQHLKLEQQLRTMQTQPADWARETVEKAISYGLVPSSLQSSYYSNITREEFCDLVVTFMEAYRGMSLDEMLATDRPQLDGIYYSDTDSQNVRICTAYDIVGGYGNAVFKPGNAITREEAAKMLTNLARALGYTQPNSASAAFADSSTFSGWAREYISFISSCVGDNAVVMGGMEQNKFVPKSNYTRQQAIVTVYRLKSYMDNTTPSQSAGAPGIPPVDPNKDVWENLFALADDPNGNHFLQYCKDDIIFNVFIQKTDEAEPRDEIMLSVSDDVTGILSNAVCNNLEKTEDTLSSTFTAENGSTGRWTVRAENGEFYLKIVMDSDTESRLNLDWSKLTPGAM